MQHVVSDQQGGTATLTTPRDLPYAANVGGNQAKFGKFGNGVLYTRIIMLHELLDVVQLHIALEYS